MRGHILRNRSSPHTDNNHNKSTSNPTPQRVVEQRGTTTTMARMQAMSTSNNLNGQNTMSSSATSKSAEMEHNSSSKDEEQNGIDLYVSITNVCVDIKSFPK
jgi:hypothetical protein